MKKLILAIFVLCLLFGAIGMVALPAPMASTNTTHELAGVTPPPVVQPPATFQLILPPLGVAWNS